MRSLVSLVFAILCMQSASVLCAPQETTTTTPSTSTTTLPPFTLPPFTLPNITFPTLPPFPILLNLTLPTFTFPPFTIPTFSLNKRSISTTEVSPLNLSCKDNKGKVRENDSTWTEIEDPCVIYACKEGLISTTTEICPIPLCKEPLSFPGECCPRCSHIDKA